VRLASPIDAAIRAGEAVHFPGDLVLLRRDGGRVPIDASASPVIDGDGSVGGAVVVFRDASERRELQSNLVVADRMVSIGLLAAGVAHEINTPLATVVANLEMARRTIVALQGASGSSRELGEVVEELGDASEASARIREIVRD